MKIIAYTNNVFESEEEEEKRPKWFAPCANKMFKEQKAVDAFIKNLLFAKMLATFDCKRYCKEKDSSSASAKKIFNLCYELVLRY